MYIFLTLEFTLLSKIYLLTTSVNAKYYLQYTVIYFTGITTCIYTELAPKLTAAASVAQSVERWSA